MVKWRFCFCQPAINPDAVDGKNAKLQEASRQAMQKSSNCKMNQAEANTLFKMGQRQADPHRTVFGLSAGGVCGIRDDERVRCR